MMTRKEAKEVFLNRGYIKVDGGTIYDANKWREACAVISKWLEQESCEELYRLITDSNSLMLLENYKTGERTVIEKRLEPCDDVISRQAAIKYFCKNFTWYDENGSITDDAEKQKAISDFMNALPPVTPAIIHCKECKFYKTEFCKMDIHHKDMTIYVAKPDDYCSYAESEAQNDKRGNNKNT